MSSKVLRIIAIVVALAGLALILRSPSLGEAAGQAVLAAHGGSADTTLYLAQMQVVTSNYGLAASLIIGAILLGAGLLRALQP
jgi:hypothetical protein